MRKQPFNVVRAAFRLAVLFVVLVAGSRVARAGEGGDTGASPEAPTSWYGWQTLIADGSVIALGAAAYAVDKSGGTELTNVFWTASFLTYLAGGPVVHWTHGHTGKGFGSLGLRIGLPLGAFLAGLLVGGATCGESEGDIVGCNVAVGAVAGLLGAVAAPVVDATILAREPVARPAGAPFQAAFVPSDGGGKLVLAGRF